MDGWRHVLVVQQEKASREHLFEGYIAWTGKIRELWQKAGDVSGKREDKEEYALKSKKGFGFRVRQAEQHMIRDLLSDDRCTEAVQAFLRLRGWESSKGGAICR